MALVGSTLVDVETDEVDDAADSAPISPAAETEKSVETPTSTVSTTRSSHILTTPAVRRLSREAKIDLALVTGSGKDGRILKEDVQSYISGSTQPSTQSPIVKSSDNESIVSLTSNQRAMFKQMTRSLSIPHFGYSDSLDMTKTSIFRDSINRALKERADSPVEKISHLAISIKALSLALSDFPILNAKVDEGGETLLYRERHNVGVAIDTPNGYELYF
jgi:2-oxoisovalerate dehydrogenase E2 component (dihydrolipoyl transacylase)